MSRSFALNVSKLLISHRQMLQQDYKIATLNELFFQNFFFQSRDDFWHLNNDEHCEVKFFQVKETYNSCSDICS